MNSFSRATINLSACKKNCRKLKKIAKKRKFFAVVKANAYGHGQKEISLAIANEVDGYCVFEVNDGKKLRKLSLEHPIVIMGGVENKTEVNTIIKHNLIPVINNHQQVDLLLNFAKKIKRIIVKVQTGMNRLGFNPKLVPDVIMQLTKAGCKNITLMHHYANGEIPHKTKQQNIVMQKLANYLGLPFTASNTGALLMNKDPGEEFVRCGIGIYGAYPTTYAKISKINTKLQAVMTLTTKILTINDLAKNQAVGYGSIWRTYKDTKIAILAAGYADGYPRATPSGTKVWCNDKYYPVVGRVSMEMIAIDIGNNANNYLQVGDVVQLWGDKLSVDYVAQSNNTIGYELLTALPAKVKKVYI